MPKPSNPILLSPPQHSPDSIQTRIQILKRGTEREPDEMVAGGVEEVSTVRGVDVEEDSWNHDRSLLQELFEERLLIVLQKKKEIYEISGSLRFGGLEKGRSKTYEAVVQGWREVIQVQPDIERADRWNLHLQP